MSKFRPSSFEEALEAKRARSTKPRKPMARGKGIQRGGSLQSAGDGAASALSARRKTPKKKKKLTDGQLKKRVWTQFSIFIRTRGADEDGFNNCVTCGARLHWKALQAGHFLRGRLNANLFSEIGTWPQCYGCNVGKQGEVVVYYRWMRAHHGEAVIDQLIQQNNKTHKWGPTELADLLAYYKLLNKTNPLLQENGQP